MLNRLNLKTRLSLQHRLNSMHSYSRLCAFMQQGLAMSFAKVYEGVMHRLIYR